MISAVFDLKLQKALWTLKNFEGPNHVYRSIRFFSNHRLSSAPSVPSLRPTLRRRLQSSKVQLLRTISLHGFCRVDLPGESARHRNLPAGSTTKTIPRIHSARRCQRETRLRIGDLIAIHSNEDLGIDRYALLDSTTIDLPLFPWARFRKHKGALKAYASRLRGSIPYFIRVDKCILVQLISIGNFLKGHILENLKYIVISIQNLDMDIARFHRIEYKVVASVGGGGIGISQFHEG